MNRYRVRYEVIIDGVYDRRDVLTVRAYDKRDARERFEASEQWHPSERFLSAELIRHEAQS